jgi:AraC-like DNA-binding protein
MLKITVTSLVNFEIHSAIHHKWPAGYCTDIPSVHCQLWLIEDGDINVRIGERQWQLTALEAFMMPVHCPRKISSPNGARLLSIGYRTPSFNQRDIFDDLSLPQQWKPSAADFRIMKNWMEQIAYLHQHHEFSHLLTQQGLGLAVLGIIWPHLGQSSAEQIAHGMLPSWLSLALRSMKEKPDITINELARLAGFSIAQFRKNFYRWMGDSPQRYLRAQRLETTCMLLETSDLSLNVIAQKVGLKSGNYLSEVFKEHYGYSPSYYRSERRSPKFSQWNNKNRDI